VVSAVVPASGDRRRPGVGHRAVEASYEAPVGPVREADLGERPRVEGARQAGLARPIPVAGTPHAVRGRIRPRHIAGPAGAASYAQRAGPSGLLVGVQDAYPRAGRPPRRRVFLVDAGRPHRAGTWRRSGWRARARPRVLSRWSAWAGGSPGCAAGRSSSLSSRWAPGGRSGLRRGLLIDGSSDGHGERGTVVAGGAIGRAPGGRVGLVRRARGPRRLSRRCSR
jgi:hypothetical protein